MTDLDAAAKGRLAERMVPVALDLVGLVRGEGDADLIGEAIGVLSEQEAKAAMVVLAAMVPQDRSPQELLAWVTWDEHGRPLPPDAVMVLYSGAGRRERATGVIECGTAPGYERHRAKGETACDPCREAANAYRRDRRRRQRRREAAEDAA